MSPLPPRTPLSEDALRRALAVRDLTDPAQGPHAVQRVLDAVVGALAAAWGCPAAVERASPVVSVEDNYDRLHYPPDGAARDARYTRYLSATHLLRTQTSAMVPPVLRRWARSGDVPSDVLLACPGVVYRRDAIDRLHSGEPHQVDLWRIRRGTALGGDDLAEMIRVVTRTAAPGRPVTLLPAVHPYTLDGREIDVGDRRAWVEIGECGLALPALLAECGLPPDASGLAMGLGLDRLVMLAKGLDDIRLLRSDEPRVAAQMRDLERWRPVSRHPPIRRDLSIAVARDTTAEDLGDRVRQALGDRAAEVEEMAVRGETPAEALSEAARERLGIAPEQKNVLLRLTLRAIGRTLTDGDANHLRDEVYAAVHEGTRWVWACGRPPGTR